MTTSDDLRAQPGRDRDFLGAFAVVERRGLLLMVQNERHFGGRSVLTWDLPGGQVEAGERLDEALRRELHEEIACPVAGAPQFLFVQEGERRSGELRRYAWRSFFFGCEVLGEPRAAGEVLAVRWFAPSELPAVLTAPYHDSFAAWLRERSAFYRSSWAD